jgi:hypothetical protein
MEHYGKRCQHTRYHTPPKLEIPVTAVTPYDVKIKWIRPPEDPSIGALIENIRMWNTELGRYYIFCRKFSIAAYYTIKNNIQCS